MKGFGLQHLVLVLAASGQATASLAGSVKIEAGDHETFTRLVVRTDDASGWKLGRTAEGYALQLPDRDLTADLSRTFGLIQRRRVADVTVAAGQGRIGIALACDCHATAFEMSGGRIVIDVADGAPAKDSPFEQDLVAGGSAPPDVLPPATAAGSAGPSANSATLTFRGKVDQIVGLPPLWQNLSPTVVPPAAPIDNPVPEEVATSPNAPPLAEATLPVALPAAAAAVPPDLPNPALRATEDALMMQLGRAASQGLVELPKPAVRPTADFESPRADPATAGVGKDDVATPPAMPGQIAFNAETSLDRDARENPMARQVTATGSACAADGDVAVTQWGTAAPMTMQLTAARAGLVGEFDRADPRAVEKLAKLYLFLGMGSEARQVLDAFPVSIRNKRVLADIGRLLDEEPVAATSPLQGMADCDTQVALWSFLAAPADLDGQNADIGAIQRGFSGLPANLRHILARRLSGRLTQIGATDAARAVRNSVAREAGPDARLVDMLDAERSLRAGKGAEAEARLDKLTEGNDPLSADAVLLAIEARSAEGKTIPAGLVEAASALAFEKRDSPDGPRFASAAILAQAASGAYGNAFGSYRRWTEEEPAVDRSATAERLFGFLTEKADDTAFLQGFFSEQAILAEVAAGAPVRLGIADRLVGLGFAEEAGQLIKADPALSGKGRLVLAKAALALYRPSEVEAQLAGLAGADADRIRAAALSMAGKPHEAAGIYARLGAGEAADAAWSAGDWATAANSARFGAATEALGLTGSGLSPLPDAGATLAGSRALLDQSQGVRKTLGTLLEGDPPSEPAPAAAAVPATATPRAPKG